MKFKVWNEHKVSMYAESGDESDDAHQFLLNVEVSNNSNISSIIEVKDKEHFMAIHTAIHNETDVNLKYIKLDPSHKRRIRISDDFDPISGYSV
jgi:hypothetical protein